MSGIIKGQSGQPIQFETVPNVNGDDVTTESVISTPNNALIKSALNASGDAPVYACRAWVNFDGEGTVAIRASGNVSSITDNGTGNYTVNFATAMPDANYYVGESGARNSTSEIRHTNVFTRTTSQVQITCVENNASNFRDTAYAGVAIFR